MLIYKISYVELENAYSRVPGMMQFSYVRRMGQAYLLQTKRLIYGPISSFLRSRPPDPGSVSGVIDIRDRCLMHLE